MKCYKLKKQKTGKIYMKIAKKKYVKVIYVYVREVKKVKIKYG